MKTFSKVALAGKTILVAGTMLLLTLTAAAQQEVAPDHFDGTPAAASQSARPKVRKQLVAAHKSKAASTTANAKHSQKTKTVAFAGGN